MRSDARRTLDLVDVYGLGVCPLVNGVGVTMKNANTVITVPGYHCRPGWQREIPLPA